MQRRILRISLSKTKSALKMLKQQIGLCPPFIIAYLKNKQLKLVDS